MTHRCLCHSFYRYRPVITLSRNHPTNGLVYDLDALRVTEAERTHLHEIAWTSKEAPNWQQSIAFHRYEEVFSHAGKQVFYNDWHDVYAVFGLKKGTKDVKTLDEAVMLVYND